jgi:hypothetical protein
MAIYFTFYYQYSLELCYFYLIFKPIACYKRAWFGFYQMGVDMNPWTIAFIAAVIAGAVCIIMAWVFNRPVEELTSQRDLYERQRDGWEEKYEKRDRQVKNIEGWIADFSVKESRIIPQLFFANWLRQTPAHDLSEGQLALFRTWLALTAGELESPDKAESLVLADEIRQQPSGLYPVVRLLEQAEADADRIKRRTGVIDDPDYAQTQATRLADV